MFENIVKHYLNFPIKGIDFIDVLPLLQDKAAFNQLTGELCRLVTTPNVVTMEARGFLFATPLLTNSSHVQTIVPLRKKGKLPFAEGDLRAVTIEKEYGQDQMYYRLSDLATCRTNGDVVEVTLLDDLLATGGTAIGMAESLNKERVVIDGREYKIHVKEFVFIVELSNLPGKSRLEPIAPVKSIISVAENI
ncbi:MAG: hypothetical protein IJU81_09170 [Bacteroidales bacterium]|nr:hypothetical protein [Bacteroidales bacterium]